MGRCEHVGPKKNFDLNFFLLRALHAKRFFVEFFGFFFNNTLVCYLVFASLFPFSLSFISVVACL